MNEISKERIEISGVEYTLFLNRKGIMAWERYCKDEKQKLQEMQDKYKDVETDIEITDDTNPFDQVDELEEDVKLISTIFRRLYWIMLYSEHKLTITQANELYDKACEEYSEEKLYELAQQMIEDVNIDKSSKSELKNLTALRPKKK